MEVYVPKARRQQQEPAENVRVDQKEAINACGEKSETKTDKEHKDVTKDKKHKNKERTRETAGSGEPDGKNHHKKHKHKSKRPRKDVDKHLVQNETHAAAVDMEEPNASISPAELGQEEHIFDASGTWDEEMHFYDSPSTEPEGNKETSSGKFAGVEHVWESVQEIFSENSVMVDPENSQQLGAREQTTGESPGLCDPITDVVSVSSSAPPTLFENAGDTDHSTCSVPAPEYETPDGSEETQGKLSKRKKSLGEDEMSQPTEIISDFIPEEPMCPKSSPCEISTADSNFGAAEVQTSESERETASVSAHVTPVTHKDETIHDRISTKTVEVDNSKPTETGVPQAEDAAIEKSSVDEAEDDADTWDTLFTDEGDALDPTLMEEVSSSGSDSWTNYKWPTSREFELHRSVQRTQHFCSLFQLTSAVGKVQIQKTQFDYYNYQPKDPDLDDPSECSVLEVPQRLFLKMLLSCLSFQIIPKRWSSELVLFFVSGFEHLIEIYDFPTELITRDLLVAFKEYKWAWTISCWRGVGLPTMFRSVEWMVVVCFGCVLSGNEVSTSSGSMTIMPLEFSQVQSPVGWRIVSSRQKPVCIGMSC